MVITHTMNNFGERQHPEKFIPSTVKKLIQGEPITVHADASRTKAGSRFYIHCRNTADAVLFLLQNSLTTSRPLRDKFNIVGEREISNLELVGMIYKYLQEEMAHTIREPRIVMTDFHSSRPGHDLRYALDGSKMKELGWTPPNTIEDSLRKTIVWMVNPANIRWLMMQNKGKEQANAGNNG